MMDKKLQTFIILLLIVFLSGLVFAGGKTIEDGVQLVPYAYDVPTIDGDLDHVWYGATAIPLLVYEDGSADTSMAYAGHYTKYRMMWDEDNLYVFVSVIDDTLSAPETLDPWFRDNIELFIDGDNSKNTGDTGYDDNDVQWRWVYGQIYSDTAGTTSSHGPGKYVFKSHSGGYNFELAIPADSLTFDLSDGTEIGFEISNRDVDGDSVKSNIKWWNSSGVAWNTPAVFGTAELEAREASDIADFIKTDGSIEVDGVFDPDEGWGGLPEFSLETIEGDTTPWTILTTWGDHQSSFWATWDVDNFYLFLKVIDDSLEAPKTLDPWFRDNLEIFIDGDNSKNTGDTGYDDNDVQWRWVYGEVYSDTASVTSSHGPGVYKFLDTEEGYNFELAIPKDSLTFDLADGTEIGFEISNRDCDSQAPQINRKWWNSSAVAWNTPAVFGTAELIDPSGTAIATEKPQIAGKFTLEQNYPNPFNPTTLIPYTLDKSGIVRLTVYNLLGQEVAVLVNQQMSAGQHKAYFDGKGLPSGIYFYKLDWAGQTVTKKMMLLK